MRLKLVQVDGRHRLLAGDTSEREDHLISCVAVQIHHHHHDDDSDGDLWLPLLPCLYLVYGSEGTQHGTGTTDLLFRCARDMLTLLREYPTVKETLWEVLRHDEVRSRQVELQDMIHKVCV